MGSSQSSQSSLVRKVPSQHKQKVDPLLRANHKHSITLSNSRPNSISQILCAACLIDFVPVSSLFSIWDQITHDTIDVTDSHDELVHNDFLSSSNLGNPDNTTRYQDFFDDEVVAQLYDYRKTIRKYLQIEQVVAGLVSNEGWAVRQLAGAIEMDSKEMCTEALSGALAFHRPLPRPLDTTDNVSAEFESESEVVRKRDELIESTLLTKTSTSESLTQLVTLNSIAVLWSYLPLTQFQRLWHYQSDVLQKLAPNQAEIGGEATMYGTEEEWRGIVGRVTEQRPQDLPGLRILKEHPKYGYQIAKSMFTA